MAQTDREAMVALYNATGGPSWKGNGNWKTDADLSRWQGIETNDQGRVVELSLHDSPQGPIPQELGNLSELMELWLQGNQLTGAIPAQLGALNKLTWLDLSLNQLSGPIPPELRNLAALEQLILYGNQLSGPIPKDLGALSELRTFVFSENRLTGPIPPELGNLAALEHLYLAGNQLSGPIPPKLGNLAGLEHLHLNKNQLSGLIPPELGNLAAVEQLYLEGNQLIGSIPPELGKLAALQELHLENNKLTGSIPPDIGKLAALRILRVSNNQLTGSIPPDIGKLAALQLLSLSNNHLTGPIPPELGNLAALEQLILSNNQLSGPIPPELGKLTALLWLRLDRNQLSGMGTDDHAASLLRLLLKPAFKADLRSKPWERPPAFKADLRSNPWERPPAAVVAAGLLSIRGYYRELERCATSPKKMQSLKVVLAGHSGAGKTSLINTILTGQGKLTQGSERETVGVEISDYNLAGQTTKFYDLAGQVDYYGLHQLFITERAVYIMTWDASKFLRQKEALVQELMGWVTALHLRAPQSTVILVGTHKDEIGGGWLTRLLSRLRREQLVTEAMADVEETLKIKYEAWKKRRGVPTGRGLAVEKGVVLVSSSPTLSEEENGVADLLKRLEGRKGTTSFVPPSWSLALVVLDALKYKVDPLDALACWKNKKPLTVRKDKQMWVEKTKITEAWEKVQDKLLDCEKAGDPSFAMESALNMREFGGSLLGHEGVVFLDVEAFALLLAPVLSHKTYEKDEEGRPMFGGKRIVEDWTIEASRHLFDRGILHGCFARFLWEKPEEDLDRLPQASMDVLVKATFNVLVKLGFVLPLGNAYFRGTTEANAIGHHNCGRTDVSEQTACGRGFLVLMRLPNEVPPDVARHLEAFEGLRKQWGLVAEWKFHDGITPHGLVERIIASCHVIGDVVGGTCWRRGACFVGNKEGTRAGNGSYALMVDFQEKAGSGDTPADRTLTIRTYGARDGKSVWGAMRFAISTVWRLFDHFPGLSWESWFECPAHIGVHLHPLPGPENRREQRSPGAPIVASSSVAFCRCNAADNVARNLGNVLSPYARMDAVFRPPAESDEGVDSIAEGASEFAVALKAVLDKVLEPAAPDDGATSDEPLMNQGESSWVDLIITGPVGALALFEVWATVQEISDRWADGEPLKKTLPMTLFVACFVVATVVARVWFLFTRWRSRRAHRLSQHSHSD